MTFFVFLLTTVLVLDCAFLILLVLIQLPKKDAGAALAFGAGATDALFGAGGGNALTKMTKYAAGIFFSLVIVLSLMTQATFRKDTSGVEQQLKQDITKLNEARQAAAAPTNSLFKSLSPTSSIPAVATGAPPVAPAVAPAATPLKTAPVVPPATPAPKP